MKIAELFESQDNQILDLIHQAQTHFGSDDLFYGNCGEFAWALATYAKQKLHKPVSLVFLTNKFDDDGNVIDDPTGADIYHVMAEIDHVRYDGNGVCSDDYIIQFAQTAYYKTVDDIELWTDYHLDSESEYLIRDGTDSTIKADQFLEFFQSLV